jgi:hypothetical protein
MKPLFLLPALDRRSGRRVAKDREAEESDSRRG